MTEPLTNGYTQNTHPDPMVRATWKALNDTGTAATAAIDTYGIDNPTTTLALAARNAATDAFLLACDNQGDKVSPHTGNVATDDDGPILTEGQQEILAWAKAPAVIHDLGGHDGHDGVITGTGNVVGDIDHLLEFLCSGEDDSGVVDVCDVLMARLAQTRDQYEANARSWDHNWETDGCPECGATSKLIDHQTWAVKSSYRIHKGEAVYGEYDLQEITGSVGHSCLNCGHEDI